MVQLTKEEDSKVNFSRDTLRLAGDVARFLPFLSKVSYGLVYLSFTGLIFRGFFYSLMFPFIHGSWTEVGWVTLIQVICASLKL